MEVSRTEGPHPAAVSKRNPVAVGRRPGHPLAVASLMPGPTGPGPAEGAGPRGAEGPQGAERAARPEAEEEAVRRPASHAVRVADRSEEDWCRSSGIPIS